MTQVNVESTFDRPLRAKAFVYSWPRLSRDWRVAPPPPISGAPENGYIGRNMPEMKRESRPGEGRLFMPRDHPTSGLNLLPQRQ